MRKPSKPLWEQALWGDNARLRDPEVQDRYGYLDDLAHREGKGIPPGLVGNHREVYYGIKHVPPGKTVHEVFCDLRADEMKFEIRMMVENALMKVHPAAGEAARRARLNPLNHPSTLY